MKKIIYAFLISLVSIITINAQELCCDTANNLLNNGNFNAATCGGNGFQNGCVPNWTRVDGSPSLAGFGTNPNAWMWSVSGVGEAISGGMNFQRGVTYNICFRVRTDDRNTGDPNVANNATINLVATNNAGNVTAIPNGEIIFQDTMGAYLNTWTTINVQFTPSADYAQLWIFPFMQQPRLNGFSQSEMNIDDIVISPVSNVVSNFTMKSEYCEDEPITPLTSPTGLMSYRWLIHEVNPSGNILQHATLGISGNVSFIDFRSLWNGYQVGKSYTVTFEYWDNCGNRHTITRQFTIKKKEVHTSCVDLACGEPFDVTALNFPDLCGGEVISIQDLVKQESLELNSPITFSESTVLKLIYDCCELFLCVNVAQKEEVQVKYICPDEEGFIRMEACGGTDGYYIYIINGLGESSTQSSRTVPYEPGGEYSVTFVSESGCTCKVIYKINCDKKESSQEKTPAQVNTQENSSGKLSNFVIHPNPSDGNYSVTSNFSKISDEKTYEIQIADISGKLILTKEAIPLETAYNLDISKYTAGIYFLTLKIGKRTEVKKLIKK